MEASEVQKAIEALEIDSSFQSYAEMYPVFGGRLKVECFTQKAEGIENIKLNKEIAIEKIKLNLLNLKTNPPDDPSKEDNNFVLEKLGGAEVTMRAIKLALEISRSADQEDRGVNLYVPSREGGAILPICSFKVFHTSLKHVQKLMYGLTTIIDNYKNNDKLTARQFFHNGELNGVFTKGEDIMKIVRNIAIQLRVDERFLNIVPESHGLICCLGTLSLNGVKGRNCNAEDVYIPSGGVCEIEFFTTPTCLIIIEHKGAFYDLVKSAIHEKLDCVLVCSSGQPDLATRRVVKDLKERYGIPVFGVFDADIYGSLTLSSFCFGTQETICFSSHLMLNDIYWLGLKPSDFSLPSEIVDENNDNIFKTIKLRKPNDHAILLTQKLLDEKFVTRNDLWAKELELLKIGTTSISCLNELHRKYLGEVWLLKKLEEGNWIHIKYHEEKRAGSQRKEKSLYH